MAWKPDYVTLSAMQGYLRIADSVDDVEIQEKITAASRAVDTCCIRQFGQLTVAASRVYEQVSYHRTTGRWRVDIDDAQDTTGLTVAVGGVTLDPSAYTLGPRNALADGKPYTHLRLVDRPCDEVTVTAKFGWTAVPAQVVTATKLQAARWLSRRESPYGIAGSPDQGSELRLLAKLDPDVATSLAGLSRRRRVG